jgi:hypothetical protein
MDDGCSLDYLVPLCRAQVECPPRNPFSDVRLKILCRRRTAGQNDIMPGAGQKNGYMPANEAGTSENDVAPQRD